MAVRRERKGSTKCCAAIDLSGAETGLDAVRNGEALADREAAACALKSSELFRGKRPAVVARGVGVGVNPSGAGSGFAEYNFAVVSVRRVQASPVVARRPRPTPYRMQTGICHVRSRSAVEPTGRYRDCWSVTLGESPVQSRAASTIGSPG